MFFGLVKAKLASPTPEFSFVFFTCSLFTPEDKWLMKVFYYYFALQNIILDYATHLSRYKFA